MSNTGIRPNVWGEPRPGLDAGALYDAIVLIASDCDDLKNRERAARQVLEQLHQLARTRAITGLLSKPGYRACGDDLIQDAIQHTAIVVCSGAGQFRGANPAVAVAWCLGILRNYARAEVRRRALMQSEPFRSPTPPTTDDNAVYEGVLWHAAAQEAHVILRSLDAQVRAYLRQTRSQRAAESLYDAVHSYVGEVAGQSSARSVRSTPACADGDEQRRARARAYQHHHRARCLLVEVREAYETGTASIRRAQADAKSQT